MKELSSLKPPEGSVRSRRRVGRGEGSGMGRTSGAGHKGQKARSGQKIRVTFEGGQMPLARRLPKRGFTNIFAGEVAVVNVEQLNRFDDGTVVDRALLLQAGLLKGTPAAVKCLGRGELTRQLTVRLDAFSRSASEKIEAKAGKAEVIRGQ
ncbi:MAG: 50S ribosomal protein L15 [Deltaproteobacteria bacterium]|nr:50S ribosomal protein L15 [Deltaproteobacteria bacterium]